MSANVTYREATAADLPAISTLLQRCSLPLDGVNDWVDDFMIAESNGSIVGSAALERYGDFGLLRSAAVADELRGQGIASQLVEKAIEKAKAAKLRDIFLLTTTAEDYFPRFGFSRIPRAEVPAELNESRELQGACPDTAIVMRRPIE